MLTAARRREPVARHRDPRKTWRQPPALLAAWLTLLTAVGFAPAAPGAESHALLIGINDYQKSAIPDLRGARNDVETMRTLLASRFGFAPDQIQTLLDRAATREGILAALKELVARAQPGDVVYVHFSGHGSQAPDRNGDEEDDQDETLVPWDGRQPGVPDITDDELSELLGGLRTDQAVVVLDSCHSGTGTRNLYLASRSIPPDDRTSLYQQRPDARGTVAVKEARHVLLTGAPAGESALDGPVDGVYRGFFSWALAQVLGRRGADLTPRQLYAGVRQEYQRLSETIGGFPLPDPQVEAAEARLAALLFPSLAEAATTPARPFVLVEPARPGYVRLLDAAPQGGAPTSRWAIYPPGETRFARDAALARAQVETLVDQDALARLEPADARLPAAARAVLLAPPEPPAKVPVELRRSRDVPPAVETEVKRLLTDELSFVELVAGDAFARFIIDIEPGRCTDCAAELVVHGAAGLVERARLPWRSGGSAAAELAAVLSRSHSATTLTGLTNPASELTLEVGVVAGPQPGAEQRGVSVQPSHVTSRYRIHRQGEPRTHRNSLMLEVQADCDCWLTVVDVDSAGKVSQLFPHPYQRQDFLPDGRVTAGQRVRIPDSLQAGNRAGFFWTYAPPAGQDTIVVFATTTEPAARRIRSFIASLQQDSDPAPRAAGLRSALPGYADRGVLVLDADEAHADTEALADDDADLPSPAPAGDWNAVAVQILVEP